MTHNWIVSRLGHGEMQCTHCLATNREIAVIGDLNHCPDAPVNHTERPCAAAGLTSYRYGSIMIGATSTRDALNEAGRSLTQGAATVERLEIWNALTGLYEKVKE